MILDIIVSGLAVGSIYSLVAMAFSLVYRSTGLLNLAQGELVMLGSLIGYSFLTSMGLNYYLSLIGAMLVVGVLGYVSNWLVFQPIRQRGGRDLHVIIASIGLLIMLPQVAALIWGTRPLSYPNSLSARQLSLGDIHISGLNFLILVMAFVIMAALQLFFRLSRMGQAMRAIADDRIMSQLVGINVKKYVGLIFLLSGILTGAAGAMLGSVYYASYDLGTVGILGFAAAVVGGFGSVSGAMMGGLVIGLIEAFSGTFVSSTYSDLILYGVLIVTLLTKPTGLFGLKLRSDTA